MTIVLTAIGIIVGLAAGIAAVIVVGIVIRALIIDTGGMSTNQHSTTLANSTGSVADVLRTKGELDRDAWNTSQQMHDIMRERRNR